MLPSVPQMPLSEAAQQADNGVGQIVAADNAARRAGSPAKCVTWDLLSGENNWITCKLYSATANGVLKWPGFT